MQKLLALILFFITLGCNSSISKEDLEQQIKESIKTELAKRNKNEQVQSVQLVQKGENEYVGIAKVIQNEIEQSYDLNVVVDGDSYVYELGKPSQLQ